MHQLKLRTRKASHLLLALHPCWHSQLLRIAHFHVQNQEPARA